MKNKLSFNLTHDAGHDIVVNIKRIRDYLLNALVAQWIEHSVSTRGICGSSILSRGTMECLILLQQVSSRKVGIITLLM